jgi:hypothetical protein
MNYKNHLPHGKWIYYGKKNAEVIKIIEFKNGQKVKEYTPGKNKN